MIVNLVPYVSVPIISPFDGVLLTYLVFAAALFIQHRKGIKWRAYFNWLLGIPRDNKWFCRTFDEEQPEQKIGREWSPVLLVTALSFLLLRRVSLHEHLKHLFTVPYSVYPSLRTPAWFNDAYILAWTPIFLWAASWPEKSWLEGYFPALESFGVKPMWALFRFSNK